jgi:hypothetical protein
MENREKNTIGQNKNTEVEHDEMSAETSQGNALDNKAPRNNHSIFDEVKNLIDDIKQLRADRREAKNKK